MSNQRAGKTHAASLNDGTNISLQSLLNFCREARVDLENGGEHDAAIRFEILEEWLRNDFKGSFKYQSKMIGL